MGIRRVTIACNCIRIRKRSMGIRRVTIACNCIRIRNRSMGTRRVTIACNCIRLRKRSMGIRRVTTACNCIRIRKRSMGIRRVTIACNCIKLRKISESGGWTIAYNCISLCLLHISHLHSCSMADSWSMDRRPMPAGSEVLKARMRASNSASLHTQQLCVCVCVCMLQAQSTQCSRKLMPFNPLRHVWGTWRQYIANA